MPVFPLQQLAVSIDLKYRADIDGLRAIAVLAVVLFHAFPDHLTGGFVGVDIFFVISGYLISSIIYNELDSNSFSFLQFYCRRVRRIFPSLITVLVACYLAGWYLLIAGEYKKLGVHIAAASIFSSNFLLYREAGYFDEASDSKLLLHLWSLGIEEQFYIIWPVLLYASWKGKLNLLTVTIILMLFSFTLNIVKIQTDKVQTFYWPTTRAWELLIGACLAFQLTHVNNHFDTYKRRLDGLLHILIGSEPLKANSAILCNVASIAGTLLIILPMYFLTKAANFPGWLAVAPTLGTGLLIYVGSTSWINRKILCSRLLVGIGRISYPLYLWHWPLLIYARILLEKEISYDSRVAVIFLSILLAWITQAFIEKSCRFGQFLKMKFVFLCILMVGIALIGYYTYRTDGLPNRFPQVIRDIGNYEKYAQVSEKSYRLDTCLIHSDRKEWKFGACVDNADKLASNGVILWGDSHAAQFYPAIAAMKPVVRLTQLTVTSCPPIPGLEESSLYCKEINDYCIKRISDEKPNTVILAGIWPSYKWEALTNTVAMLRNASIKNIYLVGPVPQWQGKLPMCVYKYFVRDKLHRVPSRMHACLVPNVDRIDQAMRDFATKTMINYISPYEILCNSDGCLTRIAGNDSILTAYDFHHLTIPASRFIVSHFPSALLRLLSGI